MLTLYFRISITTMNPNQSPEPRTQRVVLFVVLSSGEEYRSLREKLKGQASPEASPGELLHSHPKCICRLPFTCKPFAESFRESMPSTLLFESKIPCNSSIVANRQSLYPSSFRFRQCAVARSQVDFSAVVLLRPHQASFRVLSRPRRPLPALPCPMLPERPYLSISLSALSCASCTAFASCAALSRAC